MVTPTGEKGGIQSNTWMDIHRDPSEAISSNSLNFTFGGAEFQESLTQRQYWQLGLGSDTAAPFFLSKKIQLWEVFFGLRVFRKNGGKKI